MSRSRLSALFLALLLVAVSAVVGGAWVLIRRDRVALVERFGADRVHAVDEATRGITSELDDVAEDLRFAGELLSTSGMPRQHERELRALLQVAREYKGIAVFAAEPDPDGDVFILAPSTEGQPLGSDVEPAMAATARRALQRRSGEIETSPPLESPWLRVFAAAVPAKGGAAPTHAVAVLVNLERYFSAVHLISTEKDTRLLVVGAHGRPTPASDPLLRNRVDALARKEKETEDALPALSALVGRMRAGERGTLRIDERQAAQLGLPRADAIAAFTPVHIKGGAHWSVATVTSTSALRSLEQAVAVRFSLAALAVAILLTAFAAWVFVSWRRTVELRESRRHAARLAHLHEKTQKILDHIPTGVLALAADGRITAVNAVLREKLGDASVGGSIRAAFSSAPEPVVARLRALLEAALQDARVRTLPGEELALFGDPGQYSLHAVPLEHPDPEVQCLLVVEDLSNLHALESRLLRAEKLATVGVLAAGIAHEVGTPLGVVRGRAEYLLQKQPGTDGLRVIIEQIDRVSRTIRQLLDFARMQPPQVEPVSLGVAAQAAEELLRLEAERRQVSLRLEVPPQLPLVSADPDQLQQVLVNLLMNAFDACERSGVVTLSAVEEKGDAGLGGRIRIDVQDDGCGIPGDRLNQVFDPFFTTKKRGQGTGLGLTIVAQIVRNHGGQITLESTAGAGTRVVVWWPSADGRDKKGERHAAA